MQQLPSNEISLFDHCVIVVKVKSNVK